MFFIANFYNITPIDFIFSHEMTSVMDLIVYTFDDDPSSGTEVIRILLHNSLISTVESAMWTEGEIVGLVISWIGLAFISVSITTFTMHYHHLINYFIEQNC